MPAPYVIRPFRMRDIERILAIERASFGADAYDRNLFAEYFHECAGLFLVVERGRRIWGYAIACARGERAELVSIAVDPAARAKGAGSAMMASVLRRLRRRRAARLTLMVRRGNEPALRFYSKYGFVKLRRVPRYYEDGCDGLLLTRKL